MPLYEYRCSQCGEKFEKLVRFGAGDGDIRCPSCGSLVVERLISLFGRVGSGGDMGFSSTSSGCAPTGGG